MGVELLQTMEWSRLCWDQSFEKIIEIDSILPVVGESYPVKFSKNEEPVKEGRSFLLWQPPHSELNGWDDKRPSEIMKSYVLEGMLKPIRANDFSFEFLVLERARLIDFLCKVREQKQSPLSYIGKEDGSSTLQWQDAHGLVKYEVGEYVYLSGSECETDLDVILSITNDGICLHYSATLHLPAHYSTLITRYYLSKEEERVFFRLLDQAENIKDNSMDFIGKGQVYGAEYW